MDFQLTEEQIAIQDMARGFATDEMLPHAGEWDEKAIFPVDTLRQAAALGFAGIYCAEAHGGSFRGRHGLSDAQCRCARDRAMNLCDEIEPDLVAAILDGIWNDPQGPHLASKGVLEGILTILLDLFGSLQEPEGSDSFYDEIDLGDFGLEPDYGIEGEDEVFPGVSDIADTLPFGKQEAILEVSPRGRSLGFSTESVARQVRGAFEGTIAKRFARGDDEVTVRVRFARDALDEADLRRSETSVGQKVGEQSLGGRTIQPHKAADEMGQRRRPAADQ